MDIARMLDTMSAASRRTRSDYHLTLGDAIKALEEIAPSAAATFDIVGTPGSVSSYRGYYSDLAFAMELKPVTVGEVLTDLRAAVSKTFQGYKGGDFLMEADTPLWLSDYGSASGIAVIGVSVIDGRAVFQTRRVKD